MSGLQILFKNQQLNKAMHSIFSKHEQRVLYFEQLQHVELVLILRDNKRLFSKKTLRLSNYCLWWNIQIQYEKRQYEQRTSIVAQRCGWKKLIYYWKQLLQMLSLSGFMDKKEGRTKKSSESDPACHRSFAPLVRRTSRLFARSANVFVVQQKLTPSNENIVLQAAKV